jgi:hypothetical protein
MTGRDQARMATIVAFRNKIISRMKISGSPLGRSSINYVGDFPYQEVVDAVDPPRSFTDKEISVGTQQVGSNVRAKVHEAAWKKLYREFDIRYER